MEGFTMKITILNGSPRHNGNTQIMADTFARAAEEKGHKVTVLNIAGMNIRGCLACKYCYSHNGKCVQDDDMKNVLAELSDTDMVVFASPIYWFDITAQLKTVIDRLYACGSTGFHFHKTALLLDAGADHVFDAAIAQYKGMTAYLKWEDMGIIKVPNMADKGDMKACPQLEEIKKLASSL